MDSSNFWELLERNRGELQMAAGNLLGAAARRSIRSILVTSCRPGEGRTTAAVSLAYALAVNASRNVLLVDACSERADLHSLFNLQQSPGLTELLQGQADEDSVVQKSQFSKLSVICGGAKTEQDAQVLEPSAFCKALGAFELTFDHVIVDCDPVLTSSHALTLADAFDGVVLAVECGATKWQVLDLARSKIEQVGGRMLGVILNKRKYNVPRALYGLV